MSFQRLSWRIRLCVRASRRLDAEAVEVRQVVIEDAPCIEHQQRRAADRVPIQEDQPPPVAD
jgi:hypothetical protein